MSACYPADAQHPGAAAACSALVAEVMLFSEGFEDSKVLSRKMVQLYKLADEQLSQQVRLHHHMVPSVCATHARGDAVSLRASSLVSGVGPMCCDVP